MESDQKQKKDILKRRLTKISVLTSDIIFYVSSYQLKLRIRKVFKELNKELGLDYKILFCSTCKDEKKIIKILRQKEKILKSLQKNLHHTGNNQFESEEILLGESIKKPLISTSFLYLKDFNKKSSLSIPLKVEHIFLR